MSGGRHLLFRHAPGVFNSASKVAPGVDLRGTGGYIIMPPSPGYTVISDAATAEWPDWLLELVLRRPRENDERPAFDHAAFALESKRLDGFLRSIVDRVRAAPEGAKHFTLRNAALSLGGIQHAAGLSDSDATAMLLNALPRGVKDLDAARQTANWGLEHGRSRPIQLEDRRRRGPVAKRTNGAGNGKNHGGQSTSDKTYSTTATYTNSHGHDEHASEAAEEPQPNIDAEAEIARLARLSLLHYAQQRASAAKDLSIPVGLLDKLVKGERGDTRPEMQGEALEFPDPEPWAQPVDGSALVYDIRDLLHRHIVLPPGAGWAIAVWCLHTFLLGITEHTPRRCQSRAWVRQDNPTGPAGAAGVPPVACRQSHARRHLPRDCTASAELVD